MTRSLPRCLLAGTLCALAGCGPQTQEELITDQEISEVQSTSSALTTAVEQPPNGPPAFHLRLTWGLLGGNRQARTWIPWTGGVKVDSGTARLQHLIFFDRHDSPQASNDPTEVRWTSRTAPHFDGVVVRIQPRTVTDKVHVTTPLFSKDFDSAQLAQGTEQRFDVDATGHQISVSAIPDVGCGGFAYGYEKQAREGWLGFGGLLTNETGDNQGVLRFRADGEAISARLMGRDGTVLAEGKGKLDGERFELELKGLGTVNGFFQPANSFSPRGSFQASLRCR